MSILAVEDTTVDKNDPDRFLVFLDAVDPSKDENVILRVHPDCMKLTPTQAKLRTFKPLWDAYEK